MTETMQIIKEIMDAKKVSQNKMAEELQVSYMTMNNWYHGKVNPRIDDVEKMLNYLGAKINICIE